MLLCGAASAQIPNAGFESWTSHGAYSTPDGWDNLDSLTSLASVYTCSQKTPGFSGMYSVKLSSQSVTGFGVVPGIAVSGKLDATTHLPASGFAYAGRPAFLTGEWQYMAMGSSSGHIAVLLTKWNTMTNHRDTVSFTDHTLAGMAMAWAPFSIPLSYVSDSTSDSAMIFLSASGTTPAAGDYLWADNLALSGTVPTAVHNLGLAIEAVAIFPNPTNGEAHIEFTTAEGSNFSINVTTATGQLVLSKIGHTQAGINSITLNTKPLVPGLYFVKLSAGYSVITKTMEVR